MIHLTVMHSHCCGFTSLSKHKLVLIVRNVYSMIIALCFSNTFFSVFQIIKWRKEALTRLDELVDESRKRVSSTSSPGSSTMPKRPSLHVDDHGYSKENPREHGIRVRRSLLMPTTLPESLPVSPAPPLLFSPPVRPALLKAVFSPQTPSIHATPHQLFVTSPRASTPTADRYRPELLPLTTPPVRVQPPAVVTPPLLDMSASPIASPKISKHLEETNLQKLLVKMDGELDGLCSTNEEFGSVLARTTDFSCLSSAAFEEMRKRVPLLFRVLSTASWTHSEPCNGDLLAMVYGMLMRQRNMWMNAFQRALTSVCLLYHAGNQVSLGKL